MGRTCMAQVSSLQATLDIGQNPGAGWLERAQPCPVPLACLHARPGLALCPHTSSHSAGPGKDSPEPRLLWGSQTSGKR